MKHKNTVTKLAFGGLFAAMITVGTILITIPTPTKGYINIGDSFVNIGAWLLGPAYGAAAAAIGSALADVITGYTVYIPATFVIKGLMALVSGLIFHRAVKAKNGRSALVPIAAAAAAELIMISGYTIFEAFVLGSWAAALQGVFWYTVKSAANIAVSELLYVAVIKRIAPAVSEKLKEKT